MKENVENNKKSWNEGSDAYTKLVHSERFLKRILDEPSAAFHHDVWKMICQYFPDLHNVNICVPSSGDNHAVFAFAMLGANVVSCDIAENQLANAKRVSEQYDWGQRIRYICADTMTLDGIPEDSFDLVYTSNGVHVWIDDLQAMYGSISRILKTDGISVMYDIHPFQRPFDDDRKIEKPYDSTGPFTDGDETTFHWRMMDIMNAMASADLSIEHVEEMYPEKDYEWPFWISLMDLENGATATPEEVDRMFDWHNNPGMALPCWLSITAVKVRN